ncbi:MAG: hypothetical protein M3Q42_03405 [Pseudomonadota bacterium]|nr:hypothetical protein [Pseudomonadota bacterium]
MDKFVGTVAVAIAFMLGANSAQSAQVGQVLGQKKTPRLTRPVPVPIPRDPLRKVPGYVNVDYPDAGAALGFPAGDDASEREFSFTVAAATNASLKKVNYRVTGPGGTRVLHVDVCGTGDAQSVPCPSIIDVRNRVRFPGKKPGAYTLAIQARDTTGALLQKTVNFSVPSEINATTRIGDDLIAPLYEGVLPPKSGAMRPHPRLAPLPAIHLDHYNSAVSDYPTPTATDELTLKTVRNRRAGRIGLCLNFMVDPNGNLLGFCGDPGIDWGLTGVAFQLSILDSTSYQPIDAMDVSTGVKLGDNSCEAEEDDGAPLNLGYFVMDDLGRVIFADDSNVINFVKVAGTGAAVLQRVATIDMTSKPLPGMHAGLRLNARDHQIAQVMPDYTDGYWFTGTGNSREAAFVGHISGARTIDYFHQFDQGHGSNEKIQNGIAMDASGIYVLSDHALYKFEMVAGRGRVAFSHDYRRASTCKPEAGTIAHFGSGSTPTLLGDDLVAFTDNADGRVNVIVLNRHRSPTNGRRQVCSVPVFSRGRSANENTLVGYRNSLIVQNWWGAPTRINAHTDGMAPGVWRIDVALDRNSCRVVWRNNDISSTATAKLSTRTGLIYLPVENYGAEQLQLAMIDFETGREARSRFDLGHLDTGGDRITPDDNQIMMMPIYTLPDGTIVQPTFDGMRVVKKSARVRVRVR